ncbi:cell divisionFtsK/SpoIIIE [Catenulispora acidiphila DSM 44928]|uniref:Cell divisionFtsK/SpoIIIE n=1 Tax=Catenulispora acidiphila (strain DSM 44928 / JCM 14897 / NBRC 102108 / NRRL B-24433 / ID139908) TaxID=479433 RepID=C7QFD0_CATAD|nr:type VII secretion protein EccCa [Catenulispora acidiphila]ACU76707.1 cell divisionFtsK/SpoIIIE [Catenulispora acidiphila DSM 44928]
MPSGTVVLQPPPDVPRGGGDGHWALNLLPIVAGLGSVVFFFMPGANALMMIVGGLTFASSLVFGAVTAVRQRNGGTSRLVDARRDYLRHLAQIRSEVVAATRAQKAAARYANPDPDTLWSLVALRERLWERRQSDPDFLTVRVGRGTAQLATQLVPPETAPMQELEPTCADALRRLLAVHGTLSDQPVAIPLRSIARLVVSGGPGPSAMCALLAQLVTFHSPDDLKICVVADGDRVQRWDWLKWLPHAQHPSAQDAAGPQRMIYDDKTDAETGLEQLLAERPRFTGIVSLIDRPHVIVILDTTSAPSSDSYTSASASSSAASSAPLISDAGLLGVTIFEMATAPAQRPKRNQMALHIAHDRTATVELPDARPGSDDRAFPIRVDTLTLGQAEGLARQLAPLRMSAGGGDEPLLSALEFTDLLGIEDAAEIYAPSLWQRASASPHDRLRAPIGVGEDGQPVVLDLKEAALGGMGPHGLCVGATGSGKSELLRSLVAALALTHSSEQVNFILADFKGGATFAGLATLPHVAAVITNLADDLTLVDRMRDALTGELNRRQELLKRAGNVKNVHDYERARAGNADLVPLPSLLVVVDEFSELLTARPEFIEMFLQIGRIGRSLGVHLLLASQRLEEGRLRGLDTFLSYRLGLKTFSAAESRAVLGVSDAHSLPSVPGSGYLKYDNESMIRFKAAYVSGPYGKAKAPAVPAARSALHRRPVWFTALHQAPVVALRAGVAEPDLSGATSVVALDAATGYQKTSAAVLDVIVDRLTGFGPAAHRVWLPPLAEPPTLESLLSGITATPDRGLSATRWRGTGLLRVPVGIVDRPAHQRQDPQVLDLSGAGGHVLVAGGPRSGKSTTLRTLMFVLALTHTPAEARFLVVDLGGGTLAPLTGVPHVSAVAGRANPDLVRRMVAEAVGVLDRREAAGGTQAGTDQGHVFLVIDGWSAFRDEFETLEQDVVDIARRGLGFGVHLLASTGRWADVRAQLKDAIGTRLELRLGDPMESEMDRRAAAEVPQGVPGRGVTRQKLHTLGAVTAGPPEELASAIAKAWQGPAAPRVRMLPSQIAYDDVVSRDRSGAGVVIGIDEARLLPVALDFEAEPHFVVFGEGEAGKSNFLRMVATGLVEEVTAGRLEARFMVIDYRRSLMGVVPEELSAGYAVAGPAALSMMSQLAEALRDRLPGPEVTAEQLRTRSWRTGKDVYVFVDDYDLVASPTMNPLGPLVELLPYARDVGLHVVIARHSGGAGRAMFDPVLQKLRDLSTAGLLLSGDREEGPLVGGARPSRQPVGRGQLVRRRGGAVLVQTALVPEPRWGEDGTGVVDRADREGDGAGVRGVDEGVSVGAREGLRSE